MALITQYFIGAEYDPMLVTWPDSDGEPIDFSDGWTFVLIMRKVGEPDVDVVKNTGIAGTNTAPNITVTWDAGDLDNVTPGPYVAQIGATNGGKDKVFEGSVIFKERFVAP